MKRNLSKKYWDLSLRKGSDGSLTSDCTVSIPNDDDDTSNSATPSTDQYMVHVHGFHHTGMGFTRHMIHKSLSSLSPVLSSSVHDSGGIASQEEGQHLHRYTPKMSKGIWMQKSRELSPGWTVVEDELSVPRFM